MVRSTANFISYDLRPAKQSERRILLDVLKIAGDCGLPIMGYRYIGMGANRFYDFLLIHKYLGLGRMISLEHDPIMFNRATFNCPYGFIDVKNTSIEDFIAADPFLDNSIMWLDYDGGIGQQVVSDISSLSTKLKKGDFCFVTVFGGVLGALLNMNSTQKLAEIQDLFGDLAGDVTLADVEKSTFHIAIHKILIAAFQHAFSTRADCVFIPYLQVIYKDSALMITVGGALLEPVMANSLSDKIKRYLPFLKHDQAIFYEIKSLNLTERERVLFDRATTLPPRKKADRAKLKALGFQTDDLAAYKDLIRYLPRYVETIV